MSKSFKGEARAQARIAQARRAARHSKIECRDNFLESDTVQKNSGGRASQPVSVRASGLDAKKALWPKDSLLYK